MANKVRAVTRERDRLPLERIEAAVAIAEIVEHATMAADRAKCPRKRLVRHRLPIARASRTAPSRARLVVSNRESSRVSSRTSNRARRPQLSPAPMVLFAGSQIRPT